MPSAFGLPDDPDRVQLILAPFLGPWQMRDYPRSRVVMADCGHRAWLNMTSDKYLGTVVTICTICFLASGDSDASDTVTMMVPGTMNYLREHFGDEVAEEARRFARDHGIEEH